MAVLLRLVTTVPKKINNCNEKINQLSNKPGLCCASGWLSNSGGHCDTGDSSITSFKS